jgi:ABC-type proline/glycine betaine transport system substrate-binding protein
MNTNYTLTTNATDKLYRDTGYELELVPVNALIMGASVRKGYTQTRAVYDLPEGRYELHSGRKVTALHVHNVKGNPACTTNVIK